MNFSMISPPLAQACSLCPNHNSQFPSHYLEQIIGFKTLISMVYKGK